MSTPFSWPHGRAAAVSLTYDDALPVHHESVAPALEAHGFCGTFYTPVNSNLIDDPDTWRRVAEAGHELGNHTLFHPCRKSSDGSMEWLDDGHDLKRYTIERWQREVGLANRVLSLIDGRTICSFGNTCHHTTVGPDDALESIDPHVMRFFNAARGDNRAQIFDPVTCDLTNLGCFSADARSLDELRPQIEKAMAQGGWIIYCMHGVGRDHRLKIDAEEHALLLEYLAHERDSVWTAPLTDVAEYLHAARDDQAEA